MYHTLNLNGNLFFLPVMDELRNENHICYKLDSCYIFTECYRGTFGQNCTKSCGKCLRGEHCHHINGTCMNGCDPGYKGIDCSKGCINIKRLFKKYATSQCTHTTIKILFIYNCLKCKAIQMFKVAIL